MAAHPSPTQDPDDPTEILRVLPDRYHDEFLAEYTAAVDTARRPQHYRELRQLLWLWRLRAVAYADPGYDDRMAAARDAGAEEFTPAEQVLPSWAGVRPDA